VSLSKGGTKLGVLNHLRSLVGLCVQDYKSLCAVVTTRATPVNIHTHLHIQKDII